MALGFIADQFDAKTAREIAARMEYVRNENSADDPFLSIEENSSSSLKGSFRRNCNGEKFLSRACRDFLSV